MQGLVRCAVGLGGSDGAPQLAVGSGDQRRQHVPGPLACCRQPRRRGDQGVEGVHHVEVALPVELAVDGGEGVPVAALQQVLHLLPHRPEHQLGRLLVDQTQQSIAQHLGVAGRTEDPGQPAQLVAQRVGELAVQQRPEGAERAAQPAGRDAHLVHGIVSVPAHVRVPLHQLTHVLGEVRPDRLGGRRALVDGGGPRRGRAV